MWERLGYWFGVRGSSLPEGDDAVFQNAINRSVLVVRPAEPFVRWAAAVGGEPVGQTRKALAEDHTAYLIARQDSLEVEEAVLEAVYAEIFERELLSWHLDKTRWPAPRTLALFRQWFELTLCGLVVDLWETPIERDAG